MDGAKARAELEARLVDIRREGLAKRTGRITFALLADEWLATYPGQAALKRSTADGYRSIVETHLKPAPRTHPRRRPRRRSPRALRRAGMLRAGAAPRTCNRHLNVVHAILKMARRQRARPRKRRRVRRAATRAAAPLADPHPGRDRPRRDGVRRARRRHRRRDGAALDRAGPSRVPRSSTRLGLRRGELLGLRWRNVHLADPAGPSLRVCETSCTAGPTRRSRPRRSGRSRSGRSSRRELFEHRARTSYAGDDELVFCHPDKGSALDHKRYADTFREALAKPRSAIACGPSTTAVTRRSRTRRRRGAPRPRSRPARGTRTSRRRSGTSTSPASCSAMRRCERRPGSSACGYRIRVPISARTLGVCCRNRRLAGTYLAGATGLEPATPGFGGRA